MRDARSIRAGIMLAAVSLAVMFMVVLWLYFVCGMGSWPGFANDDVRLTALHLAHLALDIPALLLFPLAVLFLPIWFAAIGLIVFFLDLYICVARFALFSSTGNFACTLFLFLFDLVFLLLAVFYLGFAASGIVRFGLFGDGRSVMTPYTLPRARSPQEAGGSKQLPRQTIAVDSGAAFSSTSKYIVI